MLSSAMVVYEPTHCRMGPVEILKSGNAKWCAPQPPGRIVYDDDHQIVAVPLGKRNHKISSFSQLLAAGELPMLEEPGT
jgi:hypothetical protein